jgi:DNA-binding transcriptional ArsR family regulator
MDTRWKKMVEENAQGRFEPAFEMIISDLETLKVLADPLRLSILECLVKPGTVKRVAEKVKKPPTKLYYHFNLLEKHDLIQLVDTRVVSGIIEKHYQASARYYRVERGLLAPGGSNETSAIDVSLGGLIAHARNDIAQGLAEGSIRMDADAGPHERLNFTSMTLLVSHEQLSDFHERLNALLTEFQDVISKNNEDDPRALAHKMLLIAYPGGLNPLTGQVDEGQVATPEPAAHEEA